ncbi:hypothetical protein ABID42_002260 [Arcicella rosea]|uniref:hypothetical protein n=1 Tax=Arcicella rosea TaxID=502909 RepID=UPI00345CB539
MGTSKSFSDTKHSMIPNWRNLSASLTSNCNSTTLTNDKLTIIMKNYVFTIGGASKAGRGSSKIAGKAGIKTAIKLNSFFSNFNDSGNIRDTLSAIGLTDLDNKSVGDVINFLIEYCSGTANTIDENAAKEASRKLIEELISNAKDIDEVEKLLSDQFEIGSSEELIIRYFGHYINEHLSRWFYDHLIKNKNERDCNTLFKQIKDFIFERINVMQKTNPLHKIDWSSNEAQGLIKNIQQDVLTVFE